MEEIKPFAFVLMPFHDSFDDIYRYGIKQACAELSIVAERVDEQFYSETMLGRIYRQIENADFIIADMTGKNPNVFYEVGYAHAKGKPCALLTQNSEDIPFDLQHHFHIVYGGKIGGLKEQLLPRLQWMKGELEKERRETITATITASTGTLDVTEYWHEGEFELKIVLKNVAKFRSPEIDSISITASDSWTLLSDGKECVSEKLSDGVARFFVPAPNSRIAPGALSQAEVIFKKTFWTKWSGSEKREKYRAKGNLLIDVATAEGTHPFTFDLNVDFDEIPF
ncbi:hypothetical protein [Tritonibacter mobilis]|uniref:Nucleoside 2-deoxyribosyltransferase n=1 Tax=Tritonibacter mobilis F1926 TaxID=1265309 RepID=A0A1B1A8R7_9RHOB|nr:hypothetical protein [Tritonibacter mobilis]ANP42936.1 hypothetical protein K529_019420 [Tritonibacter mobilis F1926]